MLRTVLAAAALLLAAPAAAQSQAELDSRYDRALAAGYKALFLCSAIANAEAAGGARTAEHVSQWELAGIQPPLDVIAAALPGVVRRGSDGLVAEVAVEWQPEMEPRVARHKRGAGCALLPIGSPPTKGSFEETTIPLELPAARPSNAGMPEPFAGAFGEAYGEGTRTTAVLVARDGRTLHEYYAAGFDADVPQRTWSVAKSIAATLIGAAVQRGEADVRQSAGLGASDADPRRAITIDQLLRMASGRYSDTPGNRTDPLYFGGATVEERAATWPLIHPPGSTFRYANNDTLIAVAAIEPTFAEHPPAALFERLGMRGTVAETDWRGNYILSSQVWATAPDLLRLGQLHLNDGLWNGERILPAGWVEYVSDPSGPQPEGQFGYGAGWWTMRGIDGVPDDAFAARGNRGQFVVVVPSRDVVIVRRGEDPTGASFDLAAFTRDVLAGLK